MLQFYGWATPNSQRVSIMLEECGLSYAVTGVNIRARQQFAPEILALNPYGKIPILVEDGRAIIESGAILLHLAERHGVLWGEDRATTLSWLMVALTSLGPFTGQAHHWTELAPEKPEAARAHTTALVDRVYRLLEGRLAAVRYLAGVECSIADVAAYPWVAKHHWAERDLAATPYLAAWFERMGQRPAVQRGMRVPEGARLE
ncbi:glutathione S-transferase family protein [Falsiroseomonas stagni]|uniref:Glutathione S-transferase n=1 Tax=Falsiroseomonas stagni DSM 19981 TaxID=1123062 RepID=A0A1I4BQY0_9PROT|nr:glutathione S-transferase family protein [Falsiroseomonas stagni]SFK71214.1 glutathione S-transferase [Falsiroseomonas stagni DSM 19981]